MAGVRLVRTGAERAPVEHPARQGSGGPVGTPPALHNGVLAIILFIGAEIMLFMGLFASFVLFKTASVAWPPPGQPLLPIGVTFCNTAVLLASAVTMQRAYARLREGDLVGLRSGLAATAVMGLIFLGVQGFEWSRLISYGLTLSSSTYGATFYTLIGLHAAHVLGAVLWLGAVLVGALRGRYSKERYAGVQVFSIYWYFVCGLWVLLFGAVYLA
jgi:heme/copper-type cytochrome/quinol oxidase subunit 3